MASKKGILDIEFILSVFIFVSTVSFVVIMVILGNIPGLQQMTIFEDMRSKNFQISEKLLFTEGYPVNWDENTVTSLGLSSNDYYVMDMNKISNMSNLCQNNYQRVKDLLGLSYQNDIYVNISYIEGGNLLLCGPSGPTKITEMEIERVGLVDDMPVRIAISLI